jgi:hypothetical protein
VTGEEAREKGKMAAVGGSFAAFPLLSARTDDGVKSGVKRGWRGAISQV